MIPTTRQSLRADRVQNDIRQALDYARSLEGEAKVHVISRGAESWMEADVIRSEARAMGIEHIVGCLPAELAIIPDRMRTSASALFVAGALR